MLTVYDRGDLTVEVALIEILFCDGGCSEWTYFSTPQEHKGEMLHHVCSLTVFANLVESMAEL